MKVKCDRLDLWYASDAADVYCLGTLLLVDCFSPQLVCASSAGEEGRAIIMTFGHLTFSVEWKLDGWGL
jgi:hypothetical protein